MITAATLAGPAKGKGTVLRTGDSVTVIKDLKVKGASIPLKRGTVIKNIRLVEDDDEHVEGNSDKIKGVGAEGLLLEEDLIYASAARWGHQNGTG